MINIKYKDNKLFLFKEDKVYIVEENELQNEKKFSLYIKDEKDGREKILLENKEMKEIIEYLMQKEAIPVKDYPNVFDLEQLFLSLIFHVKNEISKKILNINKEDRDKVLEYLKKLSIINVKDLNDKRYRIDDLKTLKLSIDNDGGFVFIASDIDEIINEIISNKKETKEEKVKKEEVKEESKEEVKKESVNINTDALIISIKSNASQLKELVNGFDVIRKEEEIFREKFSGKEFKVIKIWKLEKIIIEDKKDL
jgi:hypothetical protein